MSCPGEDRDGGACVPFVPGVGRDEEGRPVRAERKMKEVRKEVTMREKERPGFERSRMYQRAGLTRARVRVSWRVDCQGRRRCGDVNVGSVWRRRGDTYDGKGDADEGCYAPDDVVDLFADGGVCVFFFFFFVRVRVDRAVAAPDEVDVR
jgi:hypothetical protein